jgi:hypothetical protein
MYNEDVHKVAADFLKALERGTTYREERLEPLSISVPVETTQFVALKRHETPHYFCGFKPSGRPVFTHDLRVAKSFDPQCMTLAMSVDRLRIVGVEVQPHPTVWYEGKHRTEL